MRRGLARWLDTFWYRKASFASRCLQPLSWGYRAVVRWRRQFYRFGWLNRSRLPVPVIVVGNISVGGTGKTPFIIWLAQQLKVHGFKPGIISRGYGGQAESWPQPVTVDSAADRVGDEALLIARHAGCPMAVGPERVRAAELLLRQEPCDVVLSDDGLQHYALERDIEIAVIDGERRFGNGACLPAGPLREPKSRLDTVDFIVVNGANFEAGQFPMALQGEQAINLVTGAVKPLQDFAATTCHAVAGIGHPGRFFRLLAASGIVCIEHPFPDHHVYRSGELDFNDAPVLMTEKDAVKCTSFAHENCWYVPVSAVVDPAFIDPLLRLLREKKHG